MKTIIITGGKGKFAQSIIKANNKFNILAPSKKEMNILSQKSIDKFLNRKKIDYIIHAAAFTAPMLIHKYKLEKSISTNIIGTANVVICAKKKNIKLIYISTNFVYPGTKGNYSEVDHLYPVNEYGWTKLGGECAVQIYKKSLILRVCMNDDKFPHKKAFTDYLTSFLKKSDAAKIVLKLIDKKGIINVGGKKQSAYKFASNNDPKIMKTKLSKKITKLIGFDTSINISKLNKIISK